MDKALLKDLAAHQLWADQQHWQLLRANPTLFADEQIRKRLNHMVVACDRLQTLARGEMPDLGATGDRDSIEELETAMRNTNQRLMAMLDSNEDLDKTIKLPRGPSGPFEAPAGLLLLQAIMHGQHHRAQNAARMRELGATPPRTDFIIWYAYGRP